MSALQWFLEKKTALFQWKSWTILHTFASINFTLFTIRGLVSLLKRITQTSVEEEWNLFESKINIDLFSPGLIGSIAAIKSPHHHYEQIR
ncbi:hypothetical protein ICC18_25785 [Paenibacillus sp. WST5]|uniref:Uncharacterized protein n=2 Tax=Paenibacillus sedimenti TaxID=2770274 RepID=A0A926KT47_9BACL|nr:hypothetical protein [Paenibacillus sedimenti]